MNDGKGNVDYPLESEKQRDLPDTEGSGKFPSGGSDLKEEEMVVRAGGKDIPAGGHSGLKPRRKRRLGAFQEYEQGSS